MEDKLMAFTFDETNDYVEVIDFGTTFEWTLSFRFRHTLAQNAGIFFQYMHSWGLTAGGARIWVYFGETSNPTPSNRDVLIISAQDNVSTTTFAAGIATQFTDGNWHNVLVSHAAGGPVIATVDGVLEGVGLLAGASFNPLSNIFIGARSDLDANRFFNGDLEDVRWYEQLIDLTTFPEEIVHIADMRKLHDSAFTVTREYALPLNEAADNVAAPAGANAIIDHEDNGHTGTAVGGVVGGQGVLRV
jgi:hypothetical protein